jgi:hypothetical protein
MTVQRIYDEQGLTHVYFQRLPGQENDLLYLSIQNQITQNFPKSMDFGLIRSPITGELLQIDRFLWQVQQVIHRQIRKEEDPNDLFAYLESVATIQTCFYGAVG